MKNNANIIVSTKEIVDRWTRFIATILTLVFILPAAIMGQSPAAVNLGTAGDFVLLAKSGITTTGTTSIVGDIGVSPIASTAMTGFGLILDNSGQWAASSLVVGKIYAANYADPTPTNLTTAVGDMETAYTDAAGRTLPDYTELYSGDVTGKTLTPGLYKWSTGVLVSAGGLTISGSATDVWIFQISGNLTLASGAMVTLSGDAQASNIFWQVAGQVTLGTTSAMKGIILCKTLIAIQNGATLNGIGLAQTAITLDANAITKPGFEDQTVCESPPVINLVGDNPMTVVRFTPYVEPGAVVTDNCNPNPNLTISGSVDVNWPGAYTVTYYSVNAFGNTSVERTVNVVNEPAAVACGFLYHADKHIKVDKMVQAVGNMYSNDKIDLKKGPATFVGNLWAVKKIDIDKDVTIDGDVTAGDDVKLDKKATVTGTVLENTWVAEIPLPVLSYIAGTEDVKLKKNETLTLAPGSYKKVEADKDAVLTLTTGEYFMHEFKLKEKTQLIIDVSTGPVVINVTKKVDFDKEVTMTLLPLGEVDSRYVTINSMGDIKIDKESTVIGSLVAHKKIEFKKDVYFRGSACGEHIHVDKDGTALYHDVGIGLSKSVSSFIAENDKYKNEIQAEEVLPESFALNQNYPNPFNPTTVISYSLPEATYVTLKIYDVLGNEIALLAEGNRGAGQHTVEFNASNLSSGVYIYRLVANEFTQIKKMILSK